MAGTTGLEPATSDVTGRRSNQLNYVPAPGRHTRTSDRVSAPTPNAPNALRVELVGDIRLERMTFCL